MHSIVKALEVASQERAARSEGRAALPTAPEHQARPAVGNEWDFRYTQTATVPVARELLERNRILSASDEDPATRAMKLLRTQVMARLGAKNWRSIAVVSPSADEGKTLTAINLAIAIASSLHQTALLVDLDWRHPSVHRYFGLMPEHDLLSHLDGVSPLDKVLVNPGIPRFCIAPCRAPVVAASERLASPAMRRLHDDLRARYANRIVIFDLPPLLVTDDALSFLPNVDSVLLVIEEGKTRRADLARALALVDQSRLLGTVVNKSSRILSGY